MGVFFVVVFVLWVFLRFCCCYMGVFVVVVVVCCCLLFVVVSVVATGFKILGFAVYQIFLYHFMASKYLKTDD